MQQLWYPNVDTVVTGNPVGTPVGKFPTIAAAIAAQTETVFAGVVPQPGTTDGSLVGPGTLPAVDDFFNGFFVINEDTTPSLGLASAYARVVDYDGATRRLTLNNGVNYSLESSVALVSPVQVWLTGNLTEDVVIDKNVILNLEGHTLFGDVVQTTGEMLWIRGGSGDVTAGIEKQNQGLLWLQDLNVSRGADTTYAVLMTEDSNVGRCVMEGCRSFGHVAGRRGVCAWELRNCRNEGVPDVARTVPYRLVESLAAIPIVLSQIDAQLDTEFAGAFVYSENSVTGAGAYVSIQGNIRNAFNQDVGFGVGLEQLQRIACFKAVGGATLTPTVTDGSIYLTGTPNASRVQIAAPGPFALARALALVNVEDFSGVATVTISSASTRMNFSVDGNFSLVELEGTTAMSGAVTLDGVSTIETSIGNYDLACAIRNTCTAGVTGSVTISGAGDWTVKGGVVQLMYFEQSIGAGLPTMTISKEIFVGPSISIWRGVVFTETGLGATVTVGTYTVSGDIHLRVGTTGRVIADADGFTATLVVSADMDVISVSDEDSIFPATNTYLVDWTAGTLTASGDIVIFNAGAVGNWQGVDVSGGSATLSGDLVIENMRAENGRLIFGSGPGIGIVSGRVDFIRVDFNDFFRVIDSADAGATLTAPGTVNMDWCFIGSTFELTFGPATFIYAAGLLFMTHCKILGLVTVSGDNLSVYGARYTFFGATPSSITVAGSRISGSHFYTKCAFAGIETSGLPNVFDDFVVMTAAGALAGGIWTDVNAAGDVIAAVAGTTATEGLLINAPTGAGDRAFLLKSGFGFANSDAAVVAGDQCNLNVGGVPTNQIAGAPVVGIRSGRALEATGTTIAGRAYTNVDLR